MAYSEAYEQSSDATPAALQLGWHCPTLDEINSNHDFVIVTFGEMRGMVWPPRDACRSRLYRDPTGRLWWFLYATDDWGPVLFPAQAKDDAAMTAMRHAMAPETAA